MSADDLKARLLKLTLPKAWVDVPELGAGEGFWVWGLSGVERDEFETTMTVQKGKKRETNLANIRARFVVRVCRDSDGGRIFQDADAPAVGQLPATVLERVFEVGRRLSGMSSEDVDELGKPSPDGPRAA